MKRPTLLSGIGFAFVVAVAVAPLQWLAGPEALAWTLVALQLSYLAYLLRVCRPRAGTLSLAALNLIAGAGLLILPFPDWVLALIWAGMAGLNRSLLLDRSLVATGLNWLLIGAGSLFAGYSASRSGSFPVAIWGFFLVQSLSAWIPARPGAGSGSGTSHDPFQRPFRQARAALERIMAG